MAVNDFGAGEDIGSVGQTGSDSFAAGSGSYTVSGGGADIWNNSDAFHFVSRAVSGNLTMTAQVQNLTNTNPWAKAGLMVRASAAAVSQFVDIVVTPGQGISFQWRSGTGGSCGDVQVIKVGASVYLEICLLYTSRCV